ncbi:MAG TPA: dipeptidase [Verrucomicrobiae bacterium]|jgi:acetylornithine deacetylase/succinyl-diaminopimelate desuccinylase-like protein|nr:dipeptidase [Verrucomicrobiae bacterium]
MDQVLDYLRANRDRFVRELIEYVGIPSVSAQEQHKPDMRRAAEWIARRAKSAGLEPAIFETKGHPIVLARTPRIKGRPHFLVYGHYDVQPAEPFELWKSPPFEPRLQGKYLYGRGASDNKGQHMALLRALEAYAATGTELPCDISFLIEGEEEVGSSNLANFLRKQRKNLDCDTVVISDTGIPKVNQPALTYSLRGIVALEVTVHGPSRDLHSGLFGGSVDNPALVLCQMLARVRDKNGKITIPGFYDGVKPLTKFERNEIKKLGFNAGEYAKFLGVPQLFGEKGFTPNEQRSARPTFEINGLTSGYQGQGSKTIVPSWARAKITCRLVADQNPEKMGKLVAHYLKKAAPPTVRVDVEAGHGGEPYLVDPTSSAAQGALRALRKAFNAEPVLLREGGSIPIVTDFKRILGAETLLLGLALPDDNPHSPNEHFNLDCFEKGMRMSAYLWPELAKAVSQP